MRVGELCARLFELYPRENAADFDNVGLLVGDPDTEIRAAVVSLDCTDAAIEKAVRAGADVIVTHHPVIFGGIKSVTADSRSPIIKLIKNGISAISMHTNLDVSAGGVNDVLCSVIGLLDVEPLDADGFTIRKGRLKSAVSASRFAERLKSVLHGSVGYCLPERVISEVAVCSGSGGEFLAAAAKAGADAFVTADVKYHLFAEAERAGVALFDCGHFETEDVIVGPLAKTVGSIIGAPVYECHESGLFRI